MITEAMFADLNLKNIVYATVDKNQDLPIMFFDKNSKTYILRCFMSVDLAKEYLEALKSSRGSKPGQVFDTNSFTTESVWMLAKSLTSRTKNRVILEVWGAKGEVDIGPFILYDSEELPN